MQPLTTVIDTSESAGAIIALALDENDVAGKNSVVLPGGQYKHALPVLGKL